MRTLPHPEKSRKTGLSSLVGLAAILVFNGALSGEFEPYKGLYLMSDRLSFRKIWASITKDGFMTASDCNFVKSDFKGTLQPLLDDDEPWDDRWTGAGLNEVLVHVARALVYFSCRWEDERSMEEKAAEDEDGDGEDEEDEPKPVRIHRDDPRKREDFTSLPTVDRKALEKAYCLSPHEIHARVLNDLSTALGIPLDVSLKLVGSVEDCDDLENTMIFPTVKWTIQKPRKPMTRSSSLWDASYKHEGGSADDHMDVDEDEGDEGGDEDDDWTPGAARSKSRRRSDGGKKKVEKQSSQRASKRRRLD